MIIFGTRGTQVDGEPIENLTCPSCQHEGMQSSGVIRYFHVYWIPMFPTKKEPVLTCPHCKCCILGGEMEPEVRTELKKIVFTRGRTWVYSFGLLVMGSFGVLGMLQGLYQGVTGTYTTTSPEPPQATSSAK